MERPKLLDLFCGAGGAAMGYSRAGFDPYGIDNKPQKHFPFPFLQMDALEAMDRLLRGEGLTFSNGETLYLKNFAAFHASPPCQFGSMATRQWRQSGREYVNLIPDIRESLIKTAKPYVIENVVGEPYLKTPLKLNGALFGMNLRRTRYFETNFPIDFILLPSEARSNFRTGRPVKEGDIITPVGHFSNISYARRVMSIDWMTLGELAQAIPPAYTEYGGLHLMRHLSIIKA